MRAALLGVIPPDALVLEDSDAAGAGPGHPGLGQRLRRIAIRRLARPARVERREVIGPQILQRLPL